MKDYVTRMWWDRQQGPITKERFFEVCDDYGINSALASDLWFIRPIEHRNDPEDAIRGNLELIEDAWIARNNLLALQLQRHEFQEPKKSSLQRQKAARAAGVLTGDCDELLCDRCNGPWLSAIHNTEPKPELPAGVCTVCENEPCECKQDRAGDMSLARRRRRGGPK